MWIDSLKSPYAGIARIVMLEKDRAYHTWAHVERMMWHAENTFGFEFDPVLSDAVIAHDVIYDAKPKKELRSAEWYMRLCSDRCPAGYAHIMRTENHDLSADNRIVLLDLADFMFPDVTETNFDLLKQEAHNLYGATPQEFAVASKKVLTGIRGRIMNAKDPKEVGWFTKICVGMDRAIFLSERIENA